jgi:hypothetical protein
MDLHGPSRVVGRRNSCHFQPIISVAEEAQQKLQFLSHRDRAFPEAAKRGLVCAGPPCSGARIRFRCRAIAAAGDQESN